jgi:carotenoid cleavage dioxygenase-like enzyme
MNRRHLLLGLSGAALATILTPEFAQAAAQTAKGAAAGLDWRLAFADLDADVAPAALTLVEGRAPVGLSGSL